MRSSAYIHNESLLSEINKTLTGRHYNPSGKIGIFLPGQAGDVMTATSVLRYAEELWRNRDIVWFCNLPNADVFRYGNIAEVRTYQWEGLDVDPFTQLKDDNNRLIKDRKKDFEEIRDIDEAYFPAPWMYPYEQRANAHLPNISKNCFGVPPSYEWHPCLSFSDEERSMVKELCQLPYKKTIMIETYGGSGQTGWNDTLTRETMRVCRMVLGDCNFILPCNKYVIGNEGFPSDIIAEKGVMNLSSLTVRQTALAIDYCDLFVGVSSGISVATSAWGLKPVPKIQFCNSYACSTAALASGPFDLIAPTREMNAMKGEEKMMKLRITFTKRLTNILNSLS